MIWWLLGSIAAASAAAFALSGESNSIIGQWLGADIRVKFNADGTFSSVHADGKRRSGLYSTTGNQLIMQPTDLNSPVVDSFNIVGNKLTVTTAGGQSQTFSREA